MFATIGYIILAIVVLMLLITVHEFGHYLMGKLLKFKINEFAIGFGKAIFKRTNKNGEVFSIRMIPLGGFCAFEGEDEESSSEGAFNKQKPWKRMIVLAGGVTFNFIFGLIMSIVYLCATGYAVPQIKNIEHNNPNDIQANDIIYKVDGVHLESYRTFSELTKKYKEGENFTITLSRDGEMKDVTVHKYASESWYFLNIIEETSFPAMYLADGDELVTLAEFEEYIGSITEFDNTKFYKTKASEGGDRAAWTEEELIAQGVIAHAPSGVSLGFSYAGHAENYSLWDGIAKCFSFAIYLCWLILKTLGGLFTGATALADVGGTITAVSQIVEISRMGVDKFLLLIPFLSFNLAIFNALPIPALDGAKMVFVAIEGIFRKPVNRTVEAYIHMVGLFVLLALVIFLDIYHFIVT